MMKNTEMGNTDVLQKYFAQSINTHDTIAITNETDAPKHPDVSVIVPVFNTSLYLKDCLDSLLAQSHSNIEIICINDASSDNSLDILKNYAKKDTRVRIYSFEENVGVATCRNYALSKVRGEYVGFVDSDDWLSLDFYEKLYSQAKDGNYDVIKGGLYLSYIDEAHELSENNSKIASSLKQNKCLAIAFQYDFWTALYRHAFLQNAHAEFPKLSNGEDMVFLLSVLLHKPKFSIIEDVFYYYRQVPNSVSHSHTSSNAKSMLNHFEMKCALLNKSQLSQADYMEFYCYNIYSGMLNYYKEFIFLDLSNQENLLYLQRTIDILKQCKYLDLLLEYSPHPLLKKSIQTNSISQSDLLLLKKEICIGAHGFIFSYCKYWLRYKLARKKKRLYYKHKYLICKKLMQLKHELSNNIA